MTLSRLETVTLPGEGGAALHAGYRGTRGCKISLLIVAGGAALPRDVTRYDDAALRAYAWRSRTHGYLLVAEGTDEARLTLIARTMQRASLEHNPFDRATRTTLRESRERSVPCHG